MQGLVEALVAIGRPVIGLLAALGRMVLFGLRALSTAMTPPFYPGRFLRQLAHIGWLSLPVVGLTALFTGAALAQQIFVGGSRFNAESTVPAVTVIAIVRELGPVLAGLMVAGRVASAMAAELGTMRVTEQIDALATLRTDPMRWLVAPRLVAATLAMPFLVFVANVIGVMGGWLLATTRLGFNSTQYLQNTWQYYEAQDLVSSLVKAAIFGFLIALMGCYQGFHCRGGAEGVGRAVTDAVVASFVAILVTNLVITVLVFDQ